ncbi:hypothetical protein ACFOON_14575 [Novosphingobium piscinae]|uniref:DUF429 domain-containing protein n=1 Tax=Novosphingobium piscinae TaxID=1507448 RepID=A0A7X1KR30_9SPHN|nr:hypothetical protein [Novosphingobium piscinae]
MRAERFGHFVAIDWSGAAGERHRGIAVALAAPGTAAPVLVRPGHRWSRPEVLDWLRRDLPADSLVGFDLGISLPFSDRGAFFPGWHGSPADARALWALIDRLCAGEPHLGVTAFVDDPALAPYFRRHGGREGALFGGGRGRFRVTERAQDAMGCRPYSNFNLVGAAQVGKSSLSGMRLLHRLEGHLPVWPVDPLPPRGSVVVEIYTTLAALAAGRPPGRSKMRSHAELAAALAAPAIASAAVPGAGPIDDHASDALLSAAWLRRAAGDRALWAPAGLAEVATTEGWTFGAR